MLRSESNFTILNIIFCIFVCFFSNSALCATLRVDFHNLKRCRSSSVRSFKTRAAFTFADANFCLWNRIEVRRSIRLIGKDNYKWRFVDIYLRSWIEGPIRRMPKKLERTNRNRNDDVCFFDIRDVLKLYRIPEGWTLIDITTIASLRNFGEE